MKKHCGMTYDYSDDNTWRNTVEWCMFTKLAITLKETPCLLMFTNLMIIHEETPWNDLCLWNDPYIWPRNFAQVATSQAGYLSYFPKWQLANCETSQMAPSQVCPSHSACPLPALAVGLGPLTHPSRSICPHCSHWRLRGPNLTLGKLPLGKLYVIGKLPLWKLSTGKSPLGKYIQGVSLQLIFLLLLTFQVKRPEKLVINILLV